MPQTHLNAITDKFLELKRRFNPTYASGLSHDLEIMLYEIKGSDLRSDIRQGNRNKKRRVVGILDNTLNILEQTGCRILARGYIKAPGQAFNGNAVYTSSTQALCSGFNNYLDAENAQGIVIADSRRKHQNKTVSHSIFTKKYKKLGDDFPNILEMPLFGHSENHIGLQIADWLASALLFPILSHVYCERHIQSVHVNSNYKTLRSRYADRLKKLQYRYLTDSQYKGGITVRDNILKSRSAALIFH